MQAQFTALNTVAQGTSRVTEAVFENRLMQAHEMKRMGADIVIEGDSARITGRAACRGTRNGVGFARFSQSGDCRLGGLG